MFRRRRLRKKEKPKPPPKKGYEEMLSKITHTNLEKLEVNKPESLSDSSKDTLLQTKEKMENSGDPKEQKFEKSESNLEKLSSVKKNPN